MFMRSLQLEENKAKSSADEFANAKQRMLNIEKKKIRFASEWNLIRCAFEAINFQGYRPSSVCTIVGSHDF